MRKLSPRIGLGLVFNKEARTGLYSHTSQWTVVSVICAESEEGETEGAHMVRTLRMVFSGCDTAPTQGMGSLLQLQPC